MLKMEIGGWRSYDDCRHTLPGGGLCLFHKYNDCLLCLFQAIKGIECTFAKCGPKCDDDSLPAVQITDLIKLCDNARQMIQQCPLLVPLTMPS